jgi:hypothetical protein
LSALAVAACNVPTEPGGFSSVGETGSPPATTTGMPDTTGDASTDESGSSSESTGSGDPDSSSGSSSGTAGAVCGDGVTDVGEECDDGDDDEFDECTSQCTIPVCNDGMHNGDETDLDCGGSCQGCDLCLNCIGSNDCGTGLTCTDESKCSVHAEISVDWADNCGGVSQGTVVEDLPAGTYRASAVQSAGTLWLPPHDPDAGTGYFYEIQCNAGVDLGNIATPPGARYLTIAEAFMNLMSNVQDFDFIGGDLVCWRSDTTCNDNAGMVDFDIDYLCDEA